MNLRDKKFLNSVVVLARLGLYAGAVTWAREIVKVIEFDLPKSPHQPTTSSSTTTNYHRKS